MKIKKNRKSIALKRIIDVVASGIALIVLLPIFTVIGIFISRILMASVFYAGESWKR